ncbi:zonular occludens toxin domain-containing protein [Marinobacter sp. CA1]|uniref:zonular occludens toxin domain-containing protein n=1 Tax=Marinobacter sp. CA1 TaxID=2817656 RepID=UPI001D088BB2|nr:zonular occludens toxin domain-containing protein [Marinobacter sp. CA1]UDL05740.1 hypothetical protein J2887_02925 [Marinobacter sp. CA1]
MITLITGVPGSSKTLNAIDLVQSDPAFQGRKVYTYNIKGLTLPWQTLDADEAKRWYKLPHGSVIILDECQDLFPPEKFGSKVPEHISKLNTHRHLGIDLVLITQHPKLIDTKVRRLVGQHFHFKRQFGMESATRYTFQECADDPNDFFALKAATKTRKKFNKKLYGVYKSAEVHTHKRKIPWQLWGIVVVAVIVGYMIYSVVTNYGKRGNIGADNTTTTQEAASPLDTAKLPGTPAPAAPQSDGKTLTREQYIERWTPRLQGVPHSAPAYDKVYEVHDFPRPQCIQRQSDSSCHCYTQQATPLDIAQDQCESIVANGYWDPTQKPTRAQRVSQQGGQRGQESEGGQNQLAAQSAHARNLRALQIRTETEAMKF